MTPLFAITVSFMRLMINADALESGIVLRYGGLTCARDYGIYDYPQRAGFMWVLSRRALVSVKEALRIEVYS